MNAEEAKQHVDIGAEYKFVCQLTPPLFALANMITGKSHASIGIKYGLVEIDVKAEQPYKIKQPDNFKAGRLKFEPDKTIKHTGYSSVFSNPENAFASEADLQAFFATANIQILT